MKALILPHDKALRYFPLRILLDGEQLSYKTFCSARKTSQFQGIQFDGPDIKLAEFILVCENVRLIPIILMLCDRWRLYWCMRTRPL